MKYTVKWTAQFKRDMKRMQKQNRNMSAMKTVIRLLSEGTVLPTEYRDRALSGNYKGFRECHIEPDWLLIYEINDDTLYLYLTRTGTHSELLGL